MLKYIELILSKVKVLDYKKDVKYIIGVALSAISIVVMVVTFVLMYFGSDASIIWFFVGGFGLVIANFILVAVKRQYEFFTDEEPSFWDVAKYNLETTKENFFKRGVAGAIFTSVLIISFIVTVVFGTITLNTYYNKSGAINAGYTYNLQEAERYKGLMEEQLEKGNLKFAAECEKNMEKCIEESEWYLKYYEQMSEKLERQIPQLITVASINGVVFIAYVAFILSTRKRKAEE